MRSRNTLLGTGLIVALVVCGVWYAQDPEPKNWSLPFGSGSSVPGKPQSEITVSRLDWSADGEVLLVLSHGEVGPEGPLVLHRGAANGGRLSIDLEGESPAAAALASDGAQVLDGTWEGQFLWFNVKQDQAKRLVEPPLSAGFTAVAIAPDGSRVAAAAGDGRMCICDPRGDAPVLLLTGGMEKVRDLRFSRDGLKLVSAATDGSVAIWNVAKARLELRFAAHRDRPAVAAEFLADGERILTAGLDDTVRIWRLDGAREEWTGHFEHSEINLLALSPDGKSAAWAGLSGRIVLWDLERHHKQLEIATTVSPILCLRFLPDGSSLAAAGPDPKIRRYDPQTGREQPAIDVR